MIDHWLDVPVDEVLFVHIFQSLRNLGRDRCRLRVRQNPLFDMLLKVAMLDELHRQVQVYAIVEPAEEADEVFLILLPRLETRVWNRRGVMQQKVLTCGTLLSEKVMRALSSRTDDWVKTACCLLIRLTARTSAGDEDEGDIHCSFHTTPKLPLPRADTHLQHSVPEDVLW